MYFSIIIRQYRKLFLISPENGFLALPIATLSTALIILIKLIKYYGINVIITITMILTKYVLDTLIHDVDSFVDNR